MRRVAWVIGLAVAVCECGCVGYQLGGTLPPGVESVHVPTFKNRSNEPNVEFETTNETIREFQRVGVVDVVAMADADAIVEVTLDDIELEPLRYAQDRATTTEEYRYRIRATVILRRTVDDEIILTRKDVLGEATFDLIGDLASAKRRALPDVAKALAHNVVECVVEYW